MRRYRSKKSARAFLGCESGATAVEFALVIVPVLLFAFGIFEFGRIMNIRNNMLFSADIAERVVMMEYGTGNRNVCKEAEAVMRKAFTGGDPSRLHVDIRNEDTGFLMLRATYDTTFLVPLFGIPGPELKLSRRIPTRSSEG